MTADSEWILRRAIAQLADAMILALADLPVGEERQRHLMAMRRLRLQVLQRDNPGMGPGGHGYEERQGDL